MSLSHSFSVELAEKYGIECAILINHFQFWIQQNQATGKNFYDGKTWMYQSQREISAVYAYWSEDTIQRIIKKLLDLGVIIKGNFSNSRFDKTNWYAFENEKMFVKPGNSGMQKNKKQDTKLEIAESAAESRFASHDLGECIIGTDTKYEDITTATEAYKPTQHNIQHQSDPKKSHAVVFFNQKEKDEERDRAYVYDCLKHIQIDHDEKIWITSKHPEDAVKNAAAWVQDPNTKINTTLLRALKWACANQPQIPKKPEIIFDENRKIAEIIEREWRASDYRIDVLNKCVEFVPLRSIEQPIVIKYTENAFKDQLHSVLTKKNFTKTLPKI